MQPHCLRHTHKGPKATSLPPSHSQGSCGRLQIFGSQAQVAPILITTERPGWDALGDVDQGGLGNRLGRCKRRTSYDNG